MEFHVCHCGCGESPGEGSMFRRGHDTKLQGYLWKEVRAGGYSAVHALVELSLRGWSDTFSSADWSPAKVAIRGEPDEFLRLRVQMRTA